MALEELMRELFLNPINLGLLSVCGYLLYKIVRGNRTPPEPPQPPSLPKMKRRDFKVSELTEYDGIKNEGRILVAVNGKVFDVSRGRKFYGPEGPYGVFAGHDASRALATFSLEKETLKDEFDDLTDLTSEQMDSVREWEMQFMEKYDYIGKLLKPGEEPTDYSDEEESDKKDN
ncbi:membrane-associated progesterone receptor component 1-like [Lytechinus pictus]|uniref:membrane-associated progesterone receptor component 1-like n=1 Tax=Lytechinus variegatus TaxID=7654 RepID=UPI001BB0E81B|nr:membrane-associated progesterone receptor component 1-like [Lytechinus variegatus]XP_054754803.1 membrane-associated progesterone receptor component 1-like [Lytechinus pictus]